jgi:nicotinamide riboside kinase
VSRDRAVIVELVGPAGAGKTTLARGVSAVDSTVRSGLSLWGLPRRRLLRSAASLLPTIVGAGLDRSRLRAGEIAQMIRLGALRQVVADESARHRVILLDEGPVFALSWLDMFFARNGDQVPAAWRRRVIEDWAKLLDVVVFIDASDITLANRIRTRDKPHMVKDLPDAEIFGFSAGFRRAFERAIGELAHAGGGHVVVDTLSTETGPPNETAERLMSRLKPRRNGH